MLQLLLSGVRKKSRSADATSTRPGQLIPSAFGLEKATTAHPAGHHHQFSGPWRGQLIPRAFGLEKVTAVHSAGHHHQVSGPWGEAGRVLPFKWWCGRCRCRLPNGGGLIAGGGRWEAAQPGWDGRGRRLLDVLLLTGIRWVSSGCHGVARLPAQVTIFK